MFIDHDCSSNALAPRMPEVLAGVFEPLRIETLEDLFAEYDGAKKRMQDIAAIFDGTNTELLDHFLAANTDGRGYVNTERLFSLEPALAALDASFWQRTLELTDVIEAMPQARRDKWHELVSTHKTPPFERSTVLSTLQDLLAQRHLFFGERVDGIFRALSHAHVTNRPEGFGRRMIVAHVMGALGVNFSQAGHLADLRAVVARFMGRGEPRHYDVHRIVEAARRYNCGKWVSLDGGAIRLRVYGNGNAHLEVHPEMAWRLNAILASMYPGAIPEQHRRRPKRRAPKDFQFYSRPLPFVVIELLVDGRIDGEIFEFRYGAEEHRAYREACDVLQALGGVHQDGVFRFDYSIREVIAEVVASGVVPDQRAHQYYPTPAELAARVVAAAGIEAHHSVLEPSAGQGALATLMPAQQTTLVEISPLFAKVLRAKGREVIQTDFLRWRPRRRFDRIVMNPPFDRGQWREHLAHASELLAGGGRIVAVLPMGASGRADLLPGFACTWSAPVPFPGTSIEVVVLVADRREEG